MREEYFRPETLEEALTLLSRQGPALIAGGTDHFPAKVPGRDGRSLLDITGITDLRQILETGSQLRIGAAVTWSQLLAKPLPPAFDGLKAAARQVGSFQIQNRATLAGNICNASPAADGVPPLLTLEARVEIARANGLRQVPLAQFITGYRKTCLGPEEIVTAILVPDLTAAATSSFVKLGSRSYLVISIAMVSALLVPEDGCVAEVRVAVGSCSAVAQRLPKLEARLAGLTLSELQKSVFDAPEFYACLSPMSDVRGSASYRNGVVPRLCARAVREAAGGAGG